MSLICSSFFIGAFVGSFLLPRAADIYGRKKIFAIGVKLYIITAHCLMHHMHSLESLYAFLFLGGVSEAGRFYTAYVYLVEMMPKRL